MPYGTGSTPTRQSLPTGKSFKNSFSSPGGTIIIEFGGLSFGCRDLPKAFAIFATSLLVPPQEGAGQINFRINAALNTLSDFADGRPQYRHISEDVVNRRRLNQGRCLQQNIHDRLRAFDANARIWPHNNQVRAEPKCLTHWHCRFYAVSSRRVRSRSDCATLARFCADHDSFAFYRWVELLRNRTKESIQIKM